MHSKACVIHSDLMKRLRDRDPTLLERIFRDTNPVLFRILASNGVRSDSAEDLVQQTWEQFFSNLDKFEGRSSVRTFLAGILINKIRENRRAEGRIVLEDYNEAVLDQAFDSEGWWNRPPADPFRLLNNSQLIEFIDECIGGLTDTQRMAFLLREVEQENSTEICNVLGVSVSHLRVLLFRAKDRLRQCLEGKLE